MAALRGAVDNGGPLGILTATSQAGFHRHGDTSQNTADEGRGPPAAGQGVFISDSVTGFRNASLTWWVCGLGDQSVSPVSLSPLYTSLPVTSSLTPFDP